MSGFGVIRPALWRQLRGASDAARLLATYLLTGEHRRAGGLSRVPAAYLLADLSWDADKVAAAIAELAALSWLVYDAPAGLAYVVGWRLHDPLPNCGAACTVARELREAQREAPGSPAVRAAVGALAEEAARLLDGASPRDNAAARLRDLLAELTAPLPQTVPHTVSHTVSHTAGRGGEGKVGVSSNVSDSMNVGECSAPSGASPCGAEIPLKDGSAYAPGAAQLEAWRQAFPGVDVDGELRKAAAWCEANPAKRKTRRGAPAFLFGWLNRAKPAPASVGAGSPTVRELQGGAL